MALLPPPNQPHKRTYGHCDTFFIESEEDAYFLKRAEERERTRLHAKERQRSIAKAISNLTAELYQDDVLEHMEAMETETLPDVNSIEIQAEIQWFMRPYLIDFLIEAHCAFQLLPETLFLAINLLDRYCSKRVVYKRHYQLVGCAALLIAAKYGDRKDRVPTIRELKGMCCSLYEDDMFIQMEYHVLATLNWMVGHPTIDSFLQLALSECPSDPELEHMTSFICEISLFHKDFVSVLPSVLARSALVLARCILSRTAPQQSEWSAHYDPVIVVNLSQKISDPSSVLSTKYSTPELSRVAVTVQVFLDHQARLHRQHAPPPTPPLVMDSQDSTCMDTHSMPHTPQKGQHLTMGPHGYMTPPITPDSDVTQNGLGSVYDKQHQHAVNGSIRPMTPTPTIYTPTSSASYSSTVSNMDQNILPPIHRYDTVKLPVPQPSYGPNGVRDYHQPWNSSTVTLPSMQIERSAYHVV